MTKRRREGKGVKKVEQEWATTARLVIIEEKGETSFRGSRKRPKGEKEYGKGGRRVQYWEGKEEK